MGSITPEDNHLPFLPMPGVKYVYYNFGNAHLIVKDQKVPSNPSSAHITQKTQISAYFPHRNVPLQIIKALQKDVKSMN